MAERGDIVVITGGNGFVGQHLVKLLHEHCQKEIREIRVFDIRPYTQKLDFKPTIPVKSVQGNLCNLQDFSRALKGADCVFHLAGVISVGINPDVKAMKAVNVEGTRTVIEACLMNNVRQVVHTSSVDAVLRRGRDCVNGDEDSMPYPLDSQAAMPGYGPTKKEAEMLVIQGQGSPLADGSGVLQTVSLRSAGMYGELDVLNVVSLTLKRAARLKSWDIMSFAPREGTCQHELAYVGNVAWAHICAMRALRDKPDICGGNAYFITDDTTKQSFREHSAPFLQEVGYKYPDFRIPFTVTYFIVMFLEIINMLLRPVKAINIPISFAIMDFLGRSCTFNRARATKNLDYHPLFSYEESKKKCMKYYKQIYQDSI